ncbi:thiolase family protein [Salipaludibacillus aurantiacus]|uniref:acetyl-CoA C-acetyltransferase n=1 Tax=Salipaludibacillus aurantiacus TaxID=1601833 RepID=A0A1H9UQA1_9BACI|nr:thiolase family protein [Salipaludibacillus aurantiacus]SES11511.1 acetyl-CoA C-acetyltransferase [Salipaludibacillus aurantiacus]
MVVVVNAFRTPIGKYGGSLAGKKPEELLEHLFNNHFAHSGLPPNIVDEVVIGQTKQSAHASNIARVAGLAAGLPIETPAHTVQMQCGSGMQAVYNAWLSIVTGQSEIMLAGGVESMSQAPFYLAENRFLPPTGNRVLYDSNTESQPKSQPEALFGTFNMGETAEVLAEKYNISRQEQDEFAYNSQLKAKQAIEQEQFSDEIIPVEVRGKKNTSLVAVDEHPREVTVEKLNKLPPAFKKNGTVTAGNSSGRNDGAATLLLMKEEKAKELGLEPLAKIKAIASAGVHPKVMGTGPVPATAKALKKAGLTLNDMDVIELNEAFAAQSLAVLKEWNLPHTKHVNVNGGAIALGHPLGCSGARILVTLIHAMEKRDCQYGLGTLCVAGGQGISTIVEKYS